MNTITKAQLKTILYQQAKNDLAATRRDAKVEYKGDGRKEGVGELIVCDTKLGNIVIRYYPATRLYTIRRFDTDWTLKAEMKAAAAIRFLVDNYSITLQDTVVEG